MVTAIALWSPAAWSPAAEAREGARQPIDIPASMLPDAIAELARETGVSIGTDGALPHVRTRPIHARMDVEQALARLLAGTGFRARRVGSTAWRIERIPIQRKSPEPVVSRVRETVPSAIEVSEPIIVTGTKRDRALSGLPMAVTVVGLDGTRPFSVGSDTASVAGDVEGLALTSLGPGRNRMFLRGISDSPFSGESQSTVAVVLDDARVTYAAPDPDIRLIDMDRIELFKGPQGSLYGVGALGGIYHLVTRRADVENSSLAASAGAQVVAKGGTGVSGSAVGNLPLVRGHAALRLVGYTAKEPGWVDTGERHNANFNRITGLRAGLGLALVPGWRADFTGFAQWLESEDSRYVYQPGARSRPPQVAEPHDNDLRHIAARLARDGGGADIVLSSGVSWHEVGDTLDATIGAQGFGLTDPRELEDNRHYRVWDSEARISGNWDALGWLLGVSHVQAKQTSVSTLVSQSDARLVIDDDRRTAYDTAAFADLTLPLASDISLNAGARLFRSAVKETRLVSGGAVTRDLHRHGLTPALALAWRPDADQLVFVRYGSAFRQGGADIGSGGEVRPLKGDELAMIEAGWRARFNRGVKLDLGVWYAWWENLQSDLLQDDGRIETENAGDARVTGAEATLEVIPAPGWRIEGGANLTMAKLVHNGLDIELKDRHLPVVPEYTFRAALRRDFTLGSGDAWLRARVRYVGPARLSFDPVLDRPMGKVLETALEGHATFGAFELALAAENLLGGKADRFAFGNSLRFATMRQYTPQQPFGVSLTLLRHF